MQIGSRNEFNLEGKILWWEPDLLALMIGVKTRRRLACLWKRWDECRRAEQTHLLKLLQQYRLTWIEGIPPRPPGSQTQEAGTQGKPWKAKTHSCGRDQWVVRILNPGKEGTPKGRVVSNNPEIHKASEEDKIPLCWQDDQMMVDSCHILK